MSKSTPAKERVDYALSIFRLCKGDAADGKRGFATNDLVVQGTLDYEQKRQRILALMDAPKGDS